MSGYVDWPPVLALRWAFMVFGIIFGAIFVGVVEAINPGVIPFGFTQFLTFNGNLAEVLQHSWPFFVWVSLITFFFTGPAYAGIKDGVYGSGSKEILMNGFWISLTAAVTEEVKYRWILYLTAMPLLYLFNFFGLLEWGMTQVLIPVANFFTLGGLEPYFYTTLGWAAGAAIIDTTGSFRDQHSYLGALGYVNSWFGGMHLFWITLTYGLFAAILVHFIYDMLFFTALSLRSLEE